jgi:hypothetical protein
MRKAEDAAHHLEAQAHRIVKLMQQFGFLGRLA